MFEKFLSWWRPLVETVEVDPVAVANRRLNMVSAQVDDVLERSMS